MAEPSSALNLRLLGLCISFFGKGKLSGQTGQDAEERRLPCKLNNVNPTDWLTDVLNRINEQKVNELSELLPKNRVYKIL
ncbi:hypothetical protein FACS1894181_09480 [Bacteroidia bacterium]|nr:hypothetical protein FACS1894181_09480 [Bacteroidia bacterium]